MAVRIYLEESARRFETGVRELEVLGGFKLAGDGVPVRWSEAGVPGISWDGSRAQLSGAGEAQFFRGLGLLRERLAGGTAPFEQTEAPVFRGLGASFDLSRNAVMTVDALKRMLCRMALMGYNEAYLYTEDTYALPEYPFFGYQRGRYGAEDLRALDGWAAALGIELIPCIQTLGHLERFLHWESSAPLRDTPDVLLAGDEETYRLIEAMLRRCRACYRTKKIHLGMDEAMNLGLGGYLKKNGYHESFDIMLRHVERVGALARKHGFEPMMWSDMYFRCASPNDDYYEDDIEIPQTVIDAAPADMTLVYWDYYHDDEAFYDRYIRLHQKFAAPLRFAGGMWTWLGPAVDYDVFFKKAEPALRACLGNGVTDVMITTWGDDGGETSPQAMLLGLQAWAEFCYTGGMDRGHICRRLAACTGADGRALARISAFNKTPLLDAESDLPNAAKFLLYQDPLLGLYDLDIEGLGFAQHYASLEAEFAAYAQEGGQWTLLYRFYELLARVLKNKAELGLGLYRAYQKQDRARLAALAGQARQAAEDCGALRTGWRNAVRRGLKCWSCGWPAYRPAWKRPPLERKTGAQAACSAWRSWRRGGCSCCARPAPAACTACISGARSQAHPNAFENRRPRAAARERAGTGKRERDGYAMKRITMVIAGLGGRGHDIYGNYAMEHPDEVEIAAVADPRPERLELAQREWNIPAERCFATAEELFAQPQLADAAVIATQDRQHVVHAEAALKGGYHLLLEKPVAVDIEGCLEVLRLARRYQRHVVVCHVLRYTPFYNAIKRIIEDGRIGEVVTIQAMEQVGYWHQAHSYVRGNWRRADESSPMILAKCCHDMDILIWLTGKRARYVSSYGNNYLFRAEKAPAGAAQRCMDCAVRAGCPYDAVRYYLESGRTSVRAGRVHWPINVLDPHPTPENIEQALRTGPYGRCVYHCDNDVVDHQVVNIELDGGTTINFTMSAFTERCYRTIKVMGTHGCVEGNMDLSHLVWHDFFGHSEEMDLNVTDGSMAGHGGGDAVMVKQFVELLASGRDDEMLSSVEHSIESHLVALLAERSRLEHGRSLPVEL